MQRLLSLPPRVINVAGFRNAGNVAHVDTVWSCPGRSRPARRGWSSGFETPASSLTDELDNSSVTRKLRADIRRRLRATDTDY